jgi:hypothetical protein
MLRSPFAILLLAFEAWLRTDISKLLNSIKSRLKSKLNLRTKSKITFDNHRIFLGGQNELNIKVLDYETFKERNA